MDNSAALSATDQRSEWQRYWPVVLVGALGMAINTVHVYSTGVFIGPLEEEFGWSRARIMTGFTLFTIVGALCAPFVGMLIDRLGPRRIGLTGILLYTACLAALSLATANIMVWWGLWFLLALGGLMVKPTVWTVAVSSLFNRGRGLALAVTLCGTGLGSAVFPVLSNALINEFGWRGGYVGIGAIGALILFPVAFFCLQSATDNHRLNKRDNGEPSQPMQLSGMTVKETLMSLRFFKIAIAAFCITLAIISCLMNLVPIMTGNGLSRDMAASIAGIVGITSVCGRLATGYFLDRLDGNRIGGVVVLIPIITFFCFLWAPQSVGFAVLAAMLLGLALGAELDVVAYLVTRHFGLRSYGAIFGIIVSLWSVATGLGPLCSSYIYDTTGSYDLALWLSMPLLVLASLALFTLGPYPGFQSSDVAADEAGNIEPAAMIAEPRRS